MYHLKYYTPSMISNLSNKNSSVAPVEEESEQVLWKLFFDFINIEIEQSSISKLINNKQTNDSTKISND